MGTKADKTQPNNSWCGNGGKRRNYDKMLNFSIQNPTKYTIHDLFEHTSELKGVVHF